MKTMIFYSALLCLLIASLTGLAVATAMLPYAVQHGSVLGRWLPLRN